MGCDVNSKPKYFVLLPDLSTSTIRRINNIVGSIKTKLLSTSAPFKTLTRVLVFLHTAIFPLVIGRLSIYCFDTCPMNSALLQLISLLSFAVNRFINFLIQSLLCQMKQTFKTSYIKLSNLQSLY